MKSNEFFSHLTVWFRVSKTRVSYKHAFVL